MPEGDTLHRAATQLAPTLEGAAVESAGGAFGERHAETLVGRCVTRVEARGKNLLVWLDDAWVIHSHLGMTGAWHVYLLNVPWNKPARQAELVLSTGSAVAVCFSPKTIDLLTKTEYRRHRYLQRLGPDLMLPGLDVEAAIERFRVHDITPIGEAVMNQTIVCGIGNVYKSESLFVCRIDPWARVGSFSDEQLGHYLATTQRMMLRNRTGGKRRTRFRPDGNRLWVYGRRGEACYECGGLIAMRRQGDQGRSTYWCPACQPRSNHG